MLIVTFARRSEGIIAFRLHLVAKSTLASVFNLFCYIRYALLRFRSIPKITSPHSEETAKEGEGHYRSDEEDIPDGLI